MATPFVAGIAALHAERDALTRSDALGAALVMSARPLALPADDIGFGLVQAP